MLAPGKHLDVRRTLSGSVASSSVRVVSRRLVFFQLLADDGVLHEVLAKGRDRCLKDEEIELLASSLVERATRRVVVTGFPEVAQEGGQSIHLIQLALVDEDEPPTSIPVEAREPEESLQIDIVRYKTSGNQTRPNNAYRHRHLVAWLLDTFGHARLSSGSGVLDVAGGAGGVAFELAFRHGVPCVVVDPRPMKLNAKQRRALRSRANSQAVLGAVPPPNSPHWLADDQGQRDPTPSAADVVASATEATPVGGTPSASSAALAPPPSATVASVGEAMVGDMCGTCEEQTVDPNAVEVPSSYAEAWATEGIKCPPPRQICGLFESDFASGHHAELWRTCSIVVGMHPDQATEPIVRLALAAGKPFAVVPCCVFSKSNPHRRLRDGSPVSTHEQFCDFLESLGDGVEGSRVGRTQLNHFEGRNIVVFGLGGVATSGAPAAASLDDSLEELHLQ